MKSASLCSDAHRICASPPQSTSLMEWVHHKTDMKVPIGKNIPKALIISLGLHILLFLMLGTLYRQKPDRYIEAGTAFDIAKIHLRTPRLPMKRLPQIPPKPTVVPESMPQTQVPKVKTPSFQSPVTSVSHQDVPLKLQTPELSSATHSEERTYGNSLQARPVSGSGSGTGIGLGSGISSSGSKPGRHTGGFMAGTHIQPTLDIGGLTLPDLALNRIAKHIITNKRTNLVDIVFIIDGSGSMKNDVDAVREHLNSMTDQFDKAGINFTIGIVAFRAGTGYSLLGLDFEVVPQTRSTDKIKKVLAQLKFRGDENGLDALIRAADEVTLRNDAEVHFIFVTDEYVSGAYSSIDVMMKMKTARIKVDVIGRDEPFQKFIAKTTGGLWLPISSLSIQ